jgi:outer membrane protein assembly factor BamD (BamD/ComL family)
VKAALLLLLLWLFCAPARAQEPEEEQEREPTAEERQAFARGERAIMLHPLPIYLAPDANSKRMDTVGRGRELVILDRSREWLHVFANVDRRRHITGWMLEKGIIRGNTPNADQILFGEAVDSEAEATRRRGRRGAAEDAMRLYARLAEYFPESPLAPEAYYRAADIRWQLERAEVMATPGAREQDPRMRREIDERAMRQVRRRYPNTRWADLAAFHMLDNRLCGDWQQQSRCPEREADLYERYARDHANSPKAPEALYLAAWRRAALIEIYRSEGRANRIPEARSRAAALARSLIAQYPDTDWAKRGHRLLYMVENEIPTYGSAE